MSVTQEIEAEEYEVQEFEASMKNMVRYSPIIKMKEQEYSSAVFSLAHISPTFNHKGINFKKKQNRKLMLT